MVLDSIPLARHKVSELNRGGASLLDEAVVRGVILEATGKRQELVVVSSDRWDRVNTLAAAGWFVAEALADVAALLAGEAVPVRVSWLAAFDAEELQQLRTEVSAAARISYDTDNPVPVRDALFRWKSTAEYILAGAALHDSVEWDSVVELSRPGDEAD